MYEIDVSSDVNKAITKETTDSYGNGSYRYKTLTVARVAKISGISRGLCYQETRNGISYYSKPTNNQTLEAYLEMFLEVKFARGQITNTTYANYTSLIKSHINGTRIGKTKISKITAHELEIYYIDLLSVRTNGKATQVGVKHYNLSPLTVKKIHAIISCAQTGAVREEHIHRKRC